MKERDLKNHLEPELQEEKKKEKNKEKLRKRRSSFRHGPLDPEILRADNQVTRALEILVSYDIFKDLNR